MPEIQNVEPVIITRTGGGCENIAARRFHHPTYSKDAASLLVALGDDPGRWNAKDVREYFLDRASKCGAGTTEKLTTGLRAFLRTRCRGQCQADLDQAVPTFASWRLGILPRYLTAEQVDSLIAACDGGSPARRRDRAIILLLAVSGSEPAMSRGSAPPISSGRRARCGSPGRDAIRFDYRSRRTLETYPGLSRLQGSHLRLRPYFRSETCPDQPFKGGDGVSSAVKCVMKRAGVVSPAKGAHVLRHTAATQMLRHGVPLDQIGLVLRHRGIDTTAYYAKADVNLLKGISQPWPEVLR